MSIFKMSVEGVLCPSQKHLPSTMTEMVSNKSGQHYFTCPQDNDTGEECPVIGFKCNSDKVNCCVCTESIPQDTIIYKHQTPPAAHQKKSSVYVHYACFNLPRPQLHAKKTSPCPICKQNIIAGTDIVPCADDSGHVGHFKHYECPATQDTVPAALSRASLQLAGAQGARPYSPLSFEDVVGIKQSRTSSLQSDESPAKKLKSADSSQDTPKKSKSGYSSQDDSSK
jgi:hypothetical protein